jgi:glutathione synthetase
VQVKSEGYVQVSLSETPHRQSPCLNDASQPIQLGLFRSDYMVHVDQSKTCVKQVEFNTIASSFGGLSNHVSGLHRNLHSIDAYPDALKPIINGGSLPESTSIPNLALGLAKAHMAYTATSSPTHPTCVLFIVQDPERNVFDQRHLEYELNATHSVRTFRISFDRVLLDSRLESTSRQLLYTPPHTPHKSYEVSTLYFRAGYAPSDYTSEEHWSARLHLERSAAIKCPSILTHLAGSKKVQQVLATPESPHLARFLPDKGSSSAILETFAPIYPLDKSPAGLTARSLATNPDTAVKYVLKPQREGGGNNVYRSDIPGFLESLPESHWPAYILMEMIEPPAQANSIFRNGEVQSGDVICELGVYGACLWKDGKDGGPREILENFEAGYLLRTKGAGSAEGGVAAGFGSVDSCCLIDV